MHIGWAPHKQSNATKLYKSVKCEELQSLFDFQTWQTANLANRKFLPLALHLKTTRPSPRFTCKAYISWTSDIGYRICLELMDIMNIMNIRNISVVLN